MHVNGRGGCVCIFGFGIILDIFRKWSKKETLAKCKQSIEVTFDQTVCGYKHYLMQFIRVLRAAIVNSFGIE